VAAWIPSKTSSKVAIRSEVKARERQSTSDFVACNRVERARVMIEDLITIDRYEI
jgi:hypothetical protein